MVLINETNKKMINLIQDPASFLKPVEGNKTFFSPGSHGWDGTYVTIEKYYNPGNSGLVSGKFYLKNNNRQAHEVDKQWGGGLAIATDFVNILVEDDFITVNRGYDNLKISVNGELFEF